MGVRVYNPTSPGRRNSSVSDFKELAGVSEVPKSLRTRKKKKGGRNNQGKITARHRGGGHMQHYRLVDFKRNKDGIVGTVAAIQYDPNRTCRVALVHYADGEKRFILAPEGLVVGATVQSGPTAPPEVGNCLPMSEIPLGMQIHNIEMQAGRGGRICRSAGASAVLVAREAQWAQLTLPSNGARIQIYEGELDMVALQGFAHPPPGRTESSYHHAADPRSADLPPGGLRRLGALHSQSQTCPFGPTDRLGQPDPTVLVYARDGLLVLGTGRHKHSRRTSAA